MDIRVSRAAIERLLAEAAYAEPEECCGLVLGFEELIADIRPAANVASDRRQAFEIDPQTLIDAFRSARDGGAQVVGYYHSHPGGPAHPSTTDRARAPHDRRVWAIVSESDVTFWRDEEGGFVPLSYAVVDR